VVVIEVYADIWCPFAHVGLRRVFQRRKELAREDMTVRVRAWPLELVNDAPLDVATTAIHIAELREQVVPHLFAGFDPNNFPRTTLPALAVVAGAYRKDDHTGEAVSLALRDALFEEGLDISSPEILAKVARTHKLGAASAPDPGAVLVDWHEGRSRGVKGSPHFFCGDDLDSFCPSLIITKDALGRVHLKRDTEALDSFLRQCLASV
jgi:predicted DsbA family dithiol-disulfide isomerase